MPTISSTDRLIQHSKELHSKIARDMNYYFERIRSDDDSIEVVREELHKMLDNIAEWQGVLARSGAFLQSAQEELEMIYPELRKENRELREKLSEYEEWNEVLGDVKGARKK